MNASRLNVFHNAHYMKVFTIKNGIYFSFLAAVEEMVDQDFIVGNMFKKAYNGLFYFVIIYNYSHSLTTQNITWSHQNRVTYLVGNIYRFFSSVSGTIFRIRNFEVF